MIWLAWHMWLLLAGVFLLGIFMGWWIFGHRDHRQDSAAPETDIQKKPAEPVPAPAASTASPAPGAAAKGAAVEATRPHLYDTPTDGDPDSLQKISGIGARFEQRLNDMGVYYYAQIADWTPGEVLWVDRALGFPGRVAREKWQEQARLLLLGASLGPKTRT